MPIVIRSSDSAHWYRSDGKTAHDADLRRARKENLLYSVTSILKMWPKGRLDDWKIDNAIRIALANPMSAQETEDQYVGRIGGMIDGNLSDAAQWGRTVHAMFENYALTGTFPPVPSCFDPYRVEIEKWFSENIIKVHFAEEVLVNSDLGYAGTCDLLADTKQWGTAVCDFKRRGFREGKPNVYDTDPVQLRAYAQVCGRPYDSLVTIAVNRDTPQIFNHVWPAKNYENCWRKFIACLEMTVLLKNYRPQAQFALGFMEDSVLPAGQQTRETVTKAPKIKPKKDTGTIPMKLGDEENPACVEIYEAYPRKVGRPAAMRSIAKAIKKHAAIHVLERTREFAKGWPKGCDMGYCPHPGTWFNQERYMDDPSTWGRSKDMPCSEPGKEFSEPCIPPIELRENDPA